MSELSFEELDRLQREEGAAATIGQLVSSLRSSREYHRLFDALMLQHRQQMGLPLIQPTSFDDVPDDRQEEFERHYVDAAREIGELYLADGDIPQAWLYFRTIREPDKVAAALEAVPVPGESSPDTENLISVALYEGANPVKGLEMLLRTHGTCNTITAFDQQVHQMTPENRRRGAALPVREL